MFAVSLNSSHYARELISPLQIRFIQDLIIGSDNPSSQDLESFTEDDVELYPAVALQNEPSPHIRLPLRRLETNTARDSAGVRVSKKSTSSDGSRLSREKTEPRSIIFVDVPAASSARPPETTTPAPKAPPATQSSIPVLATPRKASARIPSTPSTPVVKPKASPRASPSDTRGSPSTHARTFSKVKHEPDDEPLQVPQLRRSPRRHASSVTKVEDEVRAVEVVATPTRRRQTPKKERYVTSPGPGGSSKLKGGILVVSDTNAKPIAFKLKSYQREDVESLKALERSALKGEIRHMGHMLSYITGCVGFAVLFDLSMY